MSNARHGRSVSRGHYAMDVYDALPQPVRHTLAGAVANFDPVQAAQIVATSGVDECLRLLAGAERAIVKSALLPASRKVSIQRP